MKDRGWMPLVEINRDPKDPEKKSRRYEFVLMDLAVVSETGKEKELAGWWNGYEWEGGRLEESDNVVSWRRRYGI